MTLTRECVNLSVSYELLTRLCLKDFSLHKYIHTQRMKYSEGENLTFLSFVVDRCDGVKGRVSPYSCHNLESRFCQFLATLGKVIIDWCA